MRRSVMRHYLSPRTVLGNGLISGAPPPGSNIHTETRGTIHADAVRNR